MKPCLQQLLRFAEGARLRVEVVLAPAVRAALAGASRDAERWLAAAEGAILELQQMSDADCRLGVVLPAGSGELHARRETNGSHRIRGSVEAPDGTRAFELDRIALQLGGPGDAFLAQASRDGLRQLARLRYQNDGNSVVIAIFHAALTARLPPAARAVLANPIAVVRLHRIPGGAA